MINKIGICDDNLDYLIQIEFLVEDIFKEINELYTIKTFPSSIELKNYLTSNNTEIDILILDIEMPEINGLEIGELIWNNELDITIIYVTSHAEYSLKAYDTFPLHYLIKPVTKLKLKEVLSLAINDKESSEGLKYELLLNFNHSSFKINLKEIMYIEKEQNKCIFKGRNNEYKSYITLTETHNRINETGYKNFLQCHQSYLINLEWVWEIKNGYFVLENGLNIPISRKYKRNCEEGFKTYFEDKICD